jgi:hypothetical protein
MDITKTSSLLSLSGRTGAIMPGVAGSGTVSQAGENPGTATEVPPAPVMETGTLGEIESPAPRVDDSSPEGGGTATLASESGGGSVSVKMAASIYVLNHSFDEQKSVLELIA